MNNICIGNFAGMYLTDENLMFVTSSGDNGDGTYTEMQTKMTMEEYEVIRNVVERAYKNKVDKQIPEGFPRIIIN